jgi:hypothetical protein
MAYKYLPASLPIQLSPKNGFIADFQNALYDGFDNTSTVFTIQEEVPFASGTLTDVDVRVNTAIDSVTGSKLGDDFKIILFKDLQHATGLGFMYFFDDNWWVTINSEIIKNLAATATVRRCNNVLKWKSADGGVYSTPCAIDYKIKMNRNLASGGTDLVLPAGMIFVTAQFNTLSNKISPNQRFLFGNPNNWIGYKIVGGGLKNYNNLKTFDNLSSGILELDMEVAYVSNGTDDVVNGIADVNNILFDYTIELNNINLSGQVGNTFQLVNTVKQNGTIVSASVIWSSNDITKATVDSNGLVTFVAAGTCTITCTLATNPSIFTGSNVTVSASPVSDYNIIISSEDNYILEGDVQIYGCYLYLNGIQQPDAFVFTIANNNVPVNNYVFTVLSNNSFSIANKAMYLYSTLDINCVSGIYNQTLSINLKGGW